VPNNDDDDDGKTTWITEKQYGRTTLRKFF
jgi:hypothetical protein